MTSTDDRRPLPLVRWLALMGLTAVAVWFCVVGLVSFGPGDPTANRKAAMAATVTTAVASTFGLVPVAMLRRLGGDWAAWAWLAAVPFRFGFTLAGLAGLIAVGRVPAGPAVLAALVAYGGLLAVETALMYGFVRGAETEKPRP